MNISQLKSVTPAGFFRSTSCPEPCQSGSAAHPGVTVSGLRNNDVAQNSDSVGLITVCNLVCNLLAVSRRAITARCPADYGCLLCFRDDLIVGWLTHLQIDTEDTLAYSAHRRKNLHCNISPLAKHLKPCKSQNQLEAACVHTCMCAICHAR